MADVRMTEMPDRGCHLHPSCLRCPRPVCIYDEPAHKRRGTRSQDARGGISERKRRVRLLAKTGRPPKAIARELGVGLRTVYRDLKLMGLNKFAGSVNPRGWGTAGR